MTIRFSKIIIVFSLALFTSFVVFGNLTDYEANFKFVQHVLSMDTISNNKILYRSIAQPIIHHSAYILIILLEFICAICLWVSFFQMVFSFRKLIKFKSAKNIGILGLMIGFCLWFIGFFVVGGEWFGMWQSADWNGQEAAFRIVIIFLISIVYLSIDNE